MDAKMMTLILLAVLLACLTFPAKCEGGGFAEASAGDLRRWPDREEMEMVGSGKIHIVLCVRNRCSPGNKSCYCCQTLPNPQCFWTQQEYWDSCPNHRQHQARAQPPKPAGAIASSIVDEPRRSIT